MHVLTQFAYLDAGTGSLIIQAVIGAVAAVGVFGRRFIGNIKNKLTGKGTADNTARATKADAKVQK
jgi:hypothetical protein